MINRFRRVTPQFNTEYLPKTQQSFIPDLSGLEQIMKTVQTEYDAVNKPFQLPNYLRNSETDVKAFQEYSQQLETERANAINAFKSGNIAEGRKNIRNIENTLLSAKQPGGVHHELERGVKEYSTSLEEITKTYNDPKSPTYNPYLFKLAKDRLDKGIDTFKDDFGNYRKGISSPVLNKYIPQDQIVKQLDSIIDNIEADQVVYGGTNVKDLAGLSFKKLIEKGQKEYISPAKVAKVLLPSITPEMMMSIRQEGEAMGLEGDQSIVIDPKTKDFADTILGRTIKGLVESKVYSQTTDKSSIETDVGGLALFKHQLKKDENNVGKGTLNSQVFTFSGMPDLNFSLNKDGTVDTIPLSKEDLLQATKNPSGLISRNAFKSNGIPIKFRDFIESEDGKKTYPALVEIHNRFKSYTGNMSNEKLHKFLEIKYKEKQEALSVSKVTYNIYNPKTAKVMEELALGTGEGGLRNLANQSLIVQEQGKEPQVYNVNTFMRSYGIKDVEELKKNLHIVGDAKSSNPLAASGEQWVWTNPNGGKMKGKTIEFIASNKSEEDLRKKAPDFELGSVAYKGDKNESAFVYTGISELDQAYGKIQTKANDVYLSDVIAEQLQGDIDNKQRLELVKKLEDIQNNPNLNTYQERRVEIFDENGVNLSRRGANSLFLSDIVDIKEAINKNNK